MGAGTPKGFIEVHDSDTGHTHILSVAQISEVFADANSMDQRAKIRTAWRIYWVSENIERVQFLMRESHKD